MHIAVLVTNTDDSAFALRHPRDGEKFAALIGAVRPDWRLSVFDLPQGEYPEGLQGFDGVVIGGSPASVNDRLPWIAHAEALVRQAASLGIPLIGACFGHQLIARAMGGAVGPSPGGWVFGTAETEITAPASWMQPSASKIRLAAAHSEQVTRLPAGAEIIGTSAGCPVAAYRIGTRIFATQHHPEIDAAFLAALVEEYAPKLPVAVAEKARASQAQDIDTGLFAQWMARFFEAGIQDSAASRSMAVS